MTDASDAFHDDGDQDEIPDDEDDDLDDRLSRS
jgi:hypothetical protein